ncbi:putative MFS family arabinose efflux permease [Sodalis ligni]|uniref:Putative MFS family arabinose efflux permease n=2 Tax=Sodalis ligni TaxID=2697027 RepID=A0A4R1NC16_9GAMM|nr:putative MFS family arabinose efflux permease [Sodalis ligni]
MAVEKTEMVVMQRLTLWVMALTAGLVVANNYYNQPLLATLAVSFHVTQQSASAIAALTQFGYALGMFLLLPLGDKMERRRLVTIMLTLACLALLLFARATDFRLLLVFAFLIGFTSIVPQILPPFAAKLAGPEKAGEAVGLVMGGLLLGILLSRFVSGQIGAWLGWQVVYYMAATIMIILLFALRALLPAAKPTFKGNYLSLLISLTGLVKRHQILRITSLAAALQFGAFSLFWTTLAFYLDSLQQGYTARDAGLFGLVGAAGVLAAPAAGRLSTRINPTLLLLIGGGMMLLSFLSFALSFGNAFALIPGVIIMDLGMQISHVISMNRNYQLDSKAVSRLNTLYMVTRFLGGALGTLVGGIVWQQGHWYGICIAGAGFCILAIVIQFRLLSINQQSANAG